MTPALMEKLKETMDAQTSGTEPGTSDSEPSPSGSEAKNPEFSLFVHRHCLSDHVSFVIVTFLCNRIFYVVYSLYSQSTVFVVMEYKEFTQMMLHLLCFI